MGTNQAKHKIRNYIIKSLVIALPVGGIVSYLFGPSGPVLKSLNIDLTFLLVPVIGYCVLWLLSRFSRVLIRPRPGPILAVILNGAALAFLSYFLLDQGVLLTHISPEAGDPGFLFDARHLAPWSVLYFAGFTATKLPVLFKTDSWEGLAAPGIAALGQILMGLSIWSSFAIFAHYWSAMNGIGLMFLAGMLVLAVSKLGAYGEKSGNRVVIDISRWLKVSTKRKFFLGLLIAAYVIFIRPAIFSHLPYAFLIEWIIMCIGSLFILMGIRGVIQKWYSLPVKEATWQKHIQQVNHIVDEDFNKLIVLQKDFVEAGSGNDLMPYLKQLLLNNRLNEDEISQTLQPLIEYHGKKIPWYTFGFWRRSLQRSNCDSRRLALGNVVNNLGKITHPVYQNNRRMR